VGGLKTLRDVDAMIIPGTGLLTDAFGLLGWGPYDLFRWSLTAKLCRCKLLFVNVGAGPVYGRIGRFCVKKALSVADFRSYRDESSRSYLKEIGFVSAEDSICPDLVFSLDVSALSNYSANPVRRPIIGLGVMHDTGRYSVARPNAMAYRAYLDARAEFTKWLLARGYDVRLLIGDFLDQDVMPSFKSLLAKRLSPDEEGRIIDQPVKTVDDLLSQIAAVDFVVGTRFHNIVLSIILNKPVLAISFHHKCASLMAQMGMDKYCQEINNVSSRELAEQFCQLEKDADFVKQILRAKVTENRAILEEQYRQILACVQA
jgi:polysaccharide pyruvyl transferase WcaK-like protein